jgi:hypothetical protein
MWPASAVAKIESRGGFQWQGPWVAWVLGAKPGEPARSLYHCGARGLFVACVEGQQKSPCAWWLDGSLAWGSP